MMTKKRWMGEIRIMKAQRGLNMSKCRRKPKIKQKITLLATDCAAVTGEDETVVLARGAKLKFGKDDVLMGNDISGSTGISFSQN